MNGAGGTADDSPHRDFFISYAKADRDWARWIAWQLEDFGYRVLIQEWDFVAGSNWMEGMQTGIRQSERTIAILSSQYLGSVHAQAAWEAAWSVDPRGQERKLFPIRIEKDCPCPFPLSHVVSADLFGCDEPAALRELQRHVSAIETGRAKPATAPVFPGSSGNVLRVTEAASEVLSESTGKISAPQLAGGSGHKSASFETRARTPGAISIRPRVVVALTGVIFLIITVVVMLPLFHGSAMGPETRVSRLVGPPPEVTSGQVSVTVGAVDVGPRSTAVEVSIANRALAALAVPGADALLAEAGHLDHHPVPGSTWPATVPANQTATGMIVFAEPVAAQSDRLSLTFLLPGYSPDSISVNDIRLRKNDH